MEVINLTADQFLKILRHISVTALAIVFVWRLPNIIAAITG